MIECNKRQKIVRKPSNETRFRCLNSRAESKGQVVTDSICSQCPVRSFIKKAPCKQYPPKLDQVSGWASAVKNWMLEGSPKRSDEEVAYILNNHCNEEACNWYDAEKGKCRGCGCKVTSSNMAIANKVRMATEHCPKGLW